MKMKSALIMIAVLATFVSHTLGATFLPSDSDTSLERKDLCQGKRFDDFYKCNCYFLTTTGRSALVPFEPIPPKLLKGAIRSCAESFGRAQKQALACVRIAVCKRYRNMKKCLRRANGNEFNLEKSVRGMKKFDKDCSFLPDE